MVDTEMMKLANFRLDRMESMDVLDERFRDERGKTLRDYLKQVQ